MEGRGNVRVAPAADAKDGEATVTARDPDGECWNFPLMLQTQDEWICCLDTVGDIDMCACDPVSWRGDSCPSGEQRVDRCPILEGCCTEIDPDLGCWCNDSKEEFRRHCKTELGYRRINSCSSRGIGDSLTIREKLNPSVPGAARRPGGDIETLLEQLSRSGSTREPASVSGFRVPGL